MMDLRCLLSCSVDRYSTNEGDKKIGESQSVKLLTQKRFPALESVGERIRLGGKGALFHRVDQRQYTVFSSVIHC